MYESFHWFWMVVWLGFWILIAAGLVFLIRAFLEKRTQAEKTALDILNERYARGEISREEYFEKRKDLLEGG
ncbi:MAG: SHOCT domain-containing protein [Deltaproteobacteria bacterium]|nr:SHOCT domain-containing protein [Deltaproteobacteria bacterium]MCL4873665.1 SHOCT domain-containing protein [bacterium]